MLAELRRVIVGGGTIVIGFFTGNHVEQFEHRVAPAYYWPVADISDLLGQAGFVEVDRQTRPGVDIAGQRPHAAIVAIAN